MDGDATNLPALQQSPAAQMLALIERAARDPAIDVGKMQALLQMHRDVVADQAKEEFNAAFARLAPRLPRIKKSGEVTYPVDKSKPNGRQMKAFSYARWEDIDAAIRPLLLEEGFRLSYDTQALPDGKILVVTTLTHLGGHEQKCTIGPLPLDTSGGKNNVQALGSTVSYGRRYGGTGVLNLVFEGEDDDGQKGGAEFIDAETVKQLDGFIRSGGIDFNAFCDFMGVHSLVEITVADYPRAINGISALRRRRQGAAEGGEQ